MFGSDSEFVSVIRRRLLLYTTVVSITLTLTPSFIGATTPPDLGTTTDIQYHETIGQMSAPTGYMQMPADGSLPDPPEGFVWTQWPPNENYLADSLWFSPSGEDKLTTLKVFSKPDEEQIKIVDEILQEQPDRDETILFNACVKGSEAVVRHLLEKGTAIISDKEVTLVPLHAAAFNGHLGCVKLLVDKGLDVNQEDDLGGIPLMRAAVGGRHDVVKWLLEQGANRNIPQTKQLDKNSVVPGPNVWPVDFAALSGDVAVMNLLLDYWPGIKKVRTSENHFTAGTLMAATNSGSRDMVAFVLEHGGYPQGSNEAGDEWKGNKLTPGQLDAILEALSANRVKSSFAYKEMLIEYLSPRGHGGIIPLERPWTEKEFNAVVASMMHAAESNDIETLDVLLRLQPHSEKNPQDQSTHEEHKVRAIQIVVDTILLHAVSNNAIDSARALLERHGADVDSVVLALPQYTTPLFVAAREGHTDMLELLCDFNADIHKGSGRFSNGPTALWAAIRDGRVKSAHALLRRGGPVASIDEQLTKVDSRIGLLAYADYRTPVKIVNVESEEFKQTPEGVDSWKLEIEFEDEVDWLSAIQIRRPDEDLKDEGRPLKPAPEAATS